MAILVEYGFTTDLTPTTTASGVTASSCSIGSLTSVVPATSGIGYGTPVAVVSPATGATTGNTAEATNSYIGFTIAPSSGQSINITSLTFEVARGGAATPRGIAVRSSINGYATALVSADIGTQRPTMTTITLDTSQLLYDNIQSTVGFRIYFYAPISFNVLDLDTIIINGTVVNSDVSATMNDITYGFGTYLANAGFGTLGTNIYVGQIPENTNGLWVERIGGAQSNYMPMEEAIINIYVKSTAATDAISQLDTIKRHIHRMHTTSFNGVEIYTMLVIGNVEDVSRDLEYAKIFKLTVQLVYRNKNLIS